MTMNQVDYEIYLFNYDEELIILINKEDENE